MAPESVSARVIVQNHQNSPPRHARFEYIRAIHRALEHARVEFIDENGGGAGVRLRMPAKGKTQKK